MSAFCMEKYCPKTLTKLHNTSKQLQNVTQLCCVHSQNSFSNKDGNFFLASATTRCRLTQCLLHKNSKRPRQTHPVKVLLQIMLHLHSFGCFHS